MKRYIGTKIILAAPMTARAATVAGHKTEGFPKDTVGYEVEYEDGYKSWSPPESFEGAYRLADGLSFGLALEALKYGKKVARKGWNGKGMFVYLVAGTVVPKTDLRGQAEEVMKDSPAGFITISSHIDMKAADGSLTIGWSPSQPEMLSDDWEVV